MSVRLLAYWAPKSHHLAQRICDDFAAERAFLPLDPEGSVTRNQLILSEARPDELWAEAWPEGLKLEGCEVVASQGNQALHCFELNWSEKGLEWPADLAYILYTSGSTGRPKGVMISRKNAMAFVNWAAATFPLDADDVVASIAPFHFDLSVFDLHVTRRQGARLWIPPSEAVANPRLMAREMALAGATTLYATPTFLQFLMNHGRMERHDFSALRRVLFAGEPFPVAPLEALMEMLPQAEFHNLYGPTETNVVAHWCVQLSPEHPTSIPIGGAASEARLKVSSHGELWVAGPTVACGYADGSPLAGHRDEMDAFWYATGDLVDDLGGGVFRYRGRKDRMVKRRGYRIEPSEIEAAMMASGAFLRVACLVASGPVLVLAYETKNPSKTFEDLSAIARQTMPLWMCPDTYFAPMEWPLTPSGKTDYTKLLSTWQNT